MMLEEHWKRSYFLDNLFQIAFTVLADSFGYCFRLVDWRLSLSFCSFLPVLYQLIVVAQYGEACIAKPRGTIL